MKSLAPGLPVSAVLQLMGLQSQAYAQNPNIKWRKVGVWNELRHSRQMWLVTAYYDWPGLKVPQLSSKGTGCLTRPLRL